ncbi:hypothetical protein D9M68_873810 [compost metagenome]
MAGEGVPAALDELPVGLEPTGCGGHIAIVPACALTVTGQVQGRQDALGELAGLTQDGIDEVGAEVVAAGQLIHLLQVSQLVQDELHVAQGRVVFTHG